MRIVRDRILLTTADHLRRQAEDHLRAKTTGLLPPRTKDATLRLAQEKRWLDGERQL